MILTVSGWRAWTDKKFVLEHFLFYVQVWGPQLYVRVGDADGVDKIISRWLEQAGGEVPWCQYLADWGNLGKGAGPIRNGQMLRGQSGLDVHTNVLTNRLLAFPQPGINWKTDKSGTVGCTLEAVKLGVHVDVPGYKI
jgi:hypothetical protein